MASGLHRRSKRVPTTCCGKASRGRTTTRTSTHFRDSLFLLSGFVFVTFLLFSLTLLSSFPRDASGCLYSVTCTLRCCGGAHATDAGHMPTTSRVCGVCAACVAQTFPTSARTPLWCTLRFKWTPRFGVTSEQPSLRRLSKRRSRLVQVCGVCGAWRPKAQAEQATSIPVAGCWLLVVAPWHPSCRFQLVNAPLCNAPNTSQVRKPRGWSLISVAWSFATKLRTAAPRLSARTSVWLWMWVLSDASPPPPIAHRPEWKC